jgi:hypothetical protein
VTGTTVNLEVFPSISAVKTLLLRETILKVTGQVVYDKTRSIRGLMNNYLLYAR